MERAQKQTAEPANPQRPAQAKFTSKSRENELANSPMMTAQRRKLQGLFGGTAQFKGPEEEPLQGKHPAGEEEFLPGKFGAQQHKSAEEEPLQGKFDTVQRAEEEENPLQGKFATVQRVEEEEPAQGKFNAIQRVEEEEPVQGKSETAQRVEEEEPLQGKFSTVQRVEEEEPLQGKLASTVPVQREKAPNNTGLPDNLKSGIESLSGLSMDNVKVHYNSSQPAQLNALAYAQGTDIHVAPGQEQHLPHEAWHVVQQAQGRVKPTMQMKEGVPVNDDHSLEHEADVMGTKAASAVQRADGMKSIAGAVLPGNVVMRRVKVTIGGEEGESGNKASTVTTLEKTKRGKAVKACMDSFTVQQDGGHAQYDCAEPNALSKFVDAKTSDVNVVEKLTGAVVGDPMDHHGHGNPTYIHPCKICKQWVKGNEGNHSIGPGLTHNTRLNPNKY